MNKIVVVKSLALNRVGNIKANPQKYIDLINRTKACANLICNTSVGIIKIMAHLIWYPKIIGYQFFY